MRSPEDSVVQDPVFVPQGHSALVIRNGVPEQFYPPGFHDLPPGPAKVEVRQLPFATSWLRPLAPPDARSMMLPFDRSALYVDGSLVGILRPSEVEATEDEPAIQAWEGFEELEPSSEPLRACLTESLRTCLPASGICCGQRMASHH